MRMNNVRLKFVNNTAYWPRGEVRKPDSEIWVNWEPYTRNTMNHYTRGVTRRGRGCDDTNLMTTPSKSRGELMSKRRCAVDFRWIGFDAKEHTKHTVAICHLLHIRSTWTQLQEYDAT